MHFLEPVDLDICNKSPSKIKKLLMLLSGHIRGHVLIAIVGRRIGSELKAHASFRGFRRRKQQGTNFLNDIPQGCIVGEKGSFNDRQTLFQNRVGRKLFAETNKSADNIDAHSNSLWAVKDIGRHESPMFRESLGSGATTAATSF